MVVSPFRSRTIEQTSLALSYRGNATALPGAKVVGPVVLTETSRREEPGATDGDEVRAGHTPEWMDRVSSGAGFHTCAGL